MTPTKGVFFDWNDPNPRALANGLSGEVCRDTGHARWGFAAAAAGMETAYLQGFDLYNEVSSGIPNKVRLQQGIEYLTTFLNGGNPLPNGELPCLTKTPGGAPMMPPLGSSAGTGELLYSQLHNRLGLAVPQLQKFLSNQRPTSVSDFIVFETLWHYNLPY